MDEYEKAAEDFCREYGVSITVGKKPKFKKHFVDDDQERWVFRVTIKRGGKSMRLSFGNSIAKGTNPPRAYDILSCLTKNDPGTFRDFCSEFGYNEYKSSSMRIYKQVLQEWGEVEWIFGDCLNALWYIS
jgi:hypothetical protein